MSEELELFAKHVKELKARVKTSDQLAEIFVEEGIKGIQRNGSMCAISVYLKRQVPELEWLRTGSDRVRAKHQGEEKVIKLGPTLEAFVRKFDQGQYRKLVGGGYSLL